MLSFRLALSTYLLVAMPNATLGMLWPYIRIDFRQPVGALGVVLVASVGASVMSGVVTGQVVARWPASSLMALGTAMTAAGLAVEAVSWSLWGFAGGSVLFGFGFGAMNSALNAHAAHHLGARDITWLHAAYGLGAIAGPLVVTAAMSGGSGWRAMFWIFAAVQGAVACLLAGAGRARVPRATVEQDVTGRPLLIVGILVVAAVESGIEISVVVWGYLFLTDGHGMSAEAAGLAVSGYWATMFMGRVLLGPVAARAGARVVLAWAVGGVALGAALMMVPGGGVVAMMVVGLAAAPIVPLVTLTTGARAGRRVVSWQVAASSVGGAVVPAGVGLAVDASQVTVLGPLLLVLSVVMCGVYAVVARSTVDPPPAV